MSTHKRLPEIYQIELTNRCNLKCPTCLRTTAMVRENDVLDFELLKTMHARGDFAGTAYIELQMAGEPTLHPQLGSIVSYLQDTCGLLVGLSTHGLLIGKKDGVLDALLDLNDLTISVDSVDPNVYHRMRYPARLPMLLEALSTFFDEYAVRRKAGRRLPFVELQLVRTEQPDTGDVDALKAVMRAHGWDEHAVVRVVDDCFSEMQGRKQRGINERSAQMCINPFCSVSVAHNGDVVSCCYVFDPKRDEVNWYGNLNENSLEEIWESDRVVEMRRSHMEGRQKDSCAKCYLYSPTLIHQNIMARHVQHKATHGRVHLPISS